MGKLDLLKEMKELYRPPSDQPVMVEIPELSYLMIDGEGDPSTSSDYGDAVVSLFAASYALKFTVRSASSGIDYKVMPLEGLWWADDMTSFTEGRRDDWRWTLMMLQPEVVTAELAAETIEATKRKKGLPALDDIRFESFTEGTSAQIMHLGPYSSEGSTIEKLHAFIGEKGLVPRGRHHEIYLGDPRRTAPERLKTVIRQPVAPLRLTL